MGIVLALVFGSLLFYIYSRLMQVEKRMALTENILLDLKMATESTLLAMGQMSGDHDHGQADHVQPISGPEPLPSQEVEELHEEDFYKNILSSAPTETVDVEENSESAAADVLKEIQLTDSTSARSSEKASVPKVEPNYESMSLKELRSLAKQKGLQVNSHAGKKEIIDTLKKGPTVEAGSGSSSFPIESAEVLE